jgi:hypothetical protein
MTHTTITCDRCRSPIESGRTRLTVEGSAARPPLPVDPQSGRQVLDLCSPCLGLLGMWLSNPAEDPKPV